MWVTRDKDGSLRLFNCKPFRFAKIPGGLNDSWEAFKGSYLIDRNMFQDLKWEDDPLEVVICEKKEYDTLQESVAKTYC